MKYSITILGQEYQSNTKKDLIKQANITLKQLNDLLKGNTRKLLYDKNTKQVEVIDIKDYNDDLKPLLIEKFGDNYNREFVRNITQLENKEIRKDIPKNKFINVMVKIKMLYDISKDKDVERHITKILEHEKDGKYYKVKDIENVAKRYVDEFFLTIPEAYNIRFEIKQILGEKGSIINFVNMKLREPKPFTFEWFKPMVLNDGNCVREYLINKYKKISKKKINNLGDNNGVSIMELNDFCKYYSIKFNCYDINCNEIISYIPDKINRSYATLKIIAYNNHIYPVSQEDITNIKLGLNNKLTNKYKLINNLENKIIKILNKGIVPIIYTHETNIIGIKFRGKIYVDDDEYFNCMKIIDKYNIIDKYDKIPSYSTIWIEINKLFFLNDKGKEIFTFSYLPYSHRFVKGGYMYVNHNVKGKFTTIDKNKSYSYSLTQLPYLIKVDYMTAKINKNPKNIKSTYMYIVEPKFSSILLPNTNIYAGYHLQYCLNEGLEFTIKEEITTNIVENKYKQMIESLFNITDKNTAKNIINRMIGMFEKSENVRDLFKINKIGKGDEIDATNGYLVDIGDYQLLFENTGPVCSVLTRKPISVQIKDMNRVILYKQMKKLNLTTNNIRQVHTDSITFIGKYDEKNILLNDDIDGWKYEDFKPIIDTCKINDTNLSFYIKSMKECMLINSYAGSGKTYDIINNLLPKLLDYIILTPSHASLQEYKNKNINSNTIQHYNNTDNIPKENIIIVDEIGMVNKSGHYLILKCLELDKKVYLYGDFNQLIPPGEDHSINSEQYINFIAKEQKILDTNYRNNFTKEYYDKIINMGYDVDQLYKEVYKHSIKSLENFTDGDNIIVYRNETKDLYNKKVIQKLGLNDGDVGLNIICKSNYLSSQGIYNNLIYKIIHKNSDKYTIKQFDDNQLVGKEFYINHQEYKKYFDLGYAITIYCKQGQSVKGYLFPKDDKKYLNGNMAYTIISRLKNK